MRQAELYYDPYDVDIDADPYPTYRRLRDEAPLYHNQRLGFWGLSRFDDVEQALKDWKRVMLPTGGAAETTRVENALPMVSALDPISKSRRENFEVFIDRSSL